MSIKQITKYVLQALGGGVVGFCFAYAVLAITRGTYKIPVEFIAGGTLIASTLINIMAFFYLQYFKKELKQSVSDSIMDEQETKKELLSSNYAILTFLAICISFIAFILLVEFLPITIWLLIVGFVNVLFSLFLNAAFPKLYSKYSDNADFPSPSDPDYHKKLFDSADEGERYIMLVALYDTFIKITHFILGAIFLVFLYAILSGHSQLFSLIVLVLLYGASQLTYQMNVRKKYKQMAN